MCTCVQLELWYGGGESTELNRMKPKHSSHLNLKHHVKLPDDASTGSGPQVGRLRPGGPMWPDQLLNPARTAFTIISSSHNCPPPFWPSLVPPRHPLTPNYRLTLTLTITLATYTDRARFPVLALEGLVQPCLAIRDVHSDIYLQQQPHGRKLSGSAPLNPGITFPEV